MIPDDYLIAAFFQAEADTIEALENTISGLQNELAETVETAQETAAYEPDEGEKVTSAVIKKALNALISDLKDSSGSSARRKLDELKKMNTAIKKLEKKIKDTKAALKEKTTELSLKLELKRLGGKAFTDENRELIRRADRLLNWMRRTKQTRKK
ncbi:MAG: hypothetical protein U9P10_15480 [Thermodesulfobacteriota bacterium]|nr:hypothetical protein [Thermodesulfobacteriota bacterium]